MDGGQLKQAQTRAYNHAKAQELSVTPTAEQKAAARELARAARLVSEDQTTEGRWRVYHRVYKRELRRLLREQQGRLAGAC